MHILRVVWIAGVVLLFANSARAATYYVSAAGSDSNSGTSEGSAWQTIDKVNAATLSAGDQVLFRRGDTFRGTLTPHASGTSGNPIRFDAYGSGALPVLSALLPLTSWTSVGGNLYEATLPAARESLAVVVVDGAVQQIGRYPRATDANGGYLTFEGHSGATSITDSDLAGVPNFLGAQIVLRVNHWVIDRGVVTGQTASSVNFTAPINTSAYPLEDGYGYFFQNHLATLTARGDWAYDASRHVITMYSDAPPSSVSAAVLDSALVVTSLHDLQFQHLRLEGGNARTASINSGTNIAITDCDIAFSGTCAAYFANTTGSSFERNHVSESLSNGVIFFGDSSSGAVIRSNLIEDSGPRAGMGEVTLATTHVGLTVRVGHDATIEYNVVRNSGHNGIVFDGDDILIKNNIVDRFCSVKDDGGGIYSWHGSLPLSLNSGRQILGNIVFNGITAPFGTAEGVAGGSASGIYMDLYAGGATIANNTVYAVPFGRGIILNNSQNVTITGNTLFGAETGIGMTHWLLSGSPLITGLDMHDNVIFPTDDTRNILRYFDMGLDTPTSSTLVGRLHGLGTIDGNYYGALNVRPFYAPYAPVGGGAAVLPDTLTLEGWRLLSGFDTSSHAIAQLPSFTIESEVATNLVSNGTFETSISGVGSYSGNSGHTITYDNTSRLTGMGSLRLDVTTAAPRISTTLLFSLGAVDASKQYVVRFSTLGTSDSGSVNVYIRRTVSMYDALTATSTRAFGTSRVDHEVLLEHPTTVTGGTLVIAIPESAGTVYLDDVEVHEVTATTRAPLETVYFITNATDSPVTRTFEGTATDARGAIHSGSVEVGAYASVILVGDGVSRGHDAIDAGVEDAGFPVTDMGGAHDGAGTGDSGVGPGLDGGLVVGPGNVALTSTCSCDIASQTRAPAPLAMLLGAALCAFGVRRIRRMRRRRHN